MKTFEEWIEERRPRYYCHDCGAEMRQSIEHRCPVTGRPSTMFSTWHVTYSMFLAYLEWTKEHDDPTGTLRNLS